MKLLIGTSLVLALLASPLDAFTVPQHAAVKVVRNHHRATSSSRRAPSLYATVEETSKAADDSLIQKELEQAVAALADDSSSTLLGKGIPYSEMTIGVLKESYAGENRVSQTPDSVRSLIKAGLNVVVESGGT